VQHQVVDLGMIRLYTVYLLHLDIMIFRISVSFDFYHFDFRYSKKNVDFFSMICVKSSLMGDS